MAMLSPSDDSVGKAGHSEAETSLNLSHRESSGQRKLELFLTAFYDVQSVGCS